MQKKFGNYEVVDEIARGGMGIVFRARQIGTSRIVALKVLLTGKGSLEQVERFHREAQAGSKVEHPNIVKIHYIGEQNNYPYFVMDYIEGHTLQHMINDKVAVRSLVAVVAKVARALHAAHQAKIVHRDIKPSNILIEGASGEPYLSDFGLAKTLDQATLTNSGALLGTPYYMAPEQVNGNKATHLSDIYSLGVVLYQCITGKLPFQAETLPELYSQIFEREPDLPRKINPHISPVLENICLMAIEKKPAQRYQDALSLAQDLESYLKHRRAVKPDSQKVFWKRILRQHKKTTFGFATAFLLLCCLLAGFLVFKGLKPPINPGKATWQKQSSEEEQKTVQKALAMANAGDHEAAIATLEDNLKKHGPAAAVYLCQGQIHKQQKNWPAALSCFSKLIELEPRADHYYERAYTILESGYYEQAQGDLDKAQKDLDKMKNKRQQDHPLQSKINELRARLALYRHHFSQAYQLYQPLLKMRAVATDTYFCGGMAAYHTGDYEQSIHNFTQALRADDLGDDRKRQALAYRGMAYRLEQQYDKAITDLQQVAEKPHDELGEAQANLADAYFRQGNTELAHKWLELAQKNAPGLPLVSETWADHYANQGKWPQTIERIRQCIELVPWESRYHYKAAIALHKNKDFQQAEKYYKQALELRPGNIKPLVDLLTCIFDQGATEEIVCLGLVSVAYLLRFYLSVDIEDTFQDQIEVLSQQYRELAYQESKMAASAKNSDYRKMLNLILAPAPEAVHQLAIEALSELHANVEMQQTLASQLQTLGQDKKKNAAVLERLQTLRQAIDAKKVQEQKRLVKRTIVRLLAARDFSALADLDHIDQSERLLREILQDTSEDSVVRFLACQALLEWGKLSAFSIVQEYLESKPDLESALLCSVALKQKKFMVDDNIFIQGLGCQTPFLRALAVRHLDIEKWQHLQALLDDPEEKVAVYAAVRLLPRLPERCRQILARSCQSSNYLVRLYCLGKIWPFQNPFQQDEPQPLPAHMKNLMPLLEKGLQDPHPLVRRLAATRIAMHRLTDISAPVYPLLQDKDELVQYQALNTIAFLGNDSKKVTQYMYDDKESLFMRSAVLPTLLKMQDNIAFLAKLRDISQQKDPRMTALLLLFIGSMGGPMFLPPYLTHTEPYVRMAAACGMIYSTDKSQIPKLKKLLKDPSPIVQKSAAASVARLVLRLEQQNATQMHKEFLASNDDIKTGAALGYYYPLLDSVLYKLMYAHGRMVSQNARVENFQLARHKDFLNFVFEEYFLKEYRELSRISERQERYLGLLTQAVELQPNAYYYYRRALLYEFAGHLDKAIADLQKALADEPDSEWCLTTYASLLDKKRDERTLLETSERLLKVNPRAWMGWFLKGKVLFRMGQREEGIKAYKQAYIVAPDMVTFSDQLMREFPELHKLTPKNGGQAGKKTQ